MLYSFLICFVATTLGAISGVGGGVIIKPVMEALSDMPLLSINFLSGCTVLAMSIVSLLRSRGSGIKIDSKKSSFLGLGAVMGGFAGKELLHFFKNASPADNLVGTVQSVLMLLLTIGVFLYMICKKRIPTLRVARFELCTLIGFLLGVLGSFLGIGGGPINLIFLYFFFSMDTKTAGLNSLYIILFSQAASFLHILLQGNIPPFSPGVMLSMVSGGILGGFAGRGYSRNMKERQLEIAFYILLVIIIGISLYNLSGYLSANITAP